jgi:hypothetical protein
VNSRGKRAALLVALVAATFVAGMVVATFTGFVVGAIGSRINDAAEGRVPTWHVPTDAEGARQALFEIASGWLRTFHELTDGSLGGMLVLAAVALVSAAPAMLVAPALGTWEPGTPGRSLRWSIGGAALIGGMCAVGILATLWDVVGLVRMAAGAEFDGYTGGGGLIMNPLLLVPAWLAAGGIWAWALARAGQSRTPDRLDRFVRWLFAGTCLELAIAAPTYALAMRRDACYCAFGSWWAIVAGTTALLVLCGPMVILMATRQARMAWMRSVCAECGYPRRGGSTVCPECGKSVPG